MYSLRISIYAFALNLYLCRHKCIYTCIHVEANVCVYVYIDNVFTKNGKSLPTDKWFINITGKINSGDLDTDSENIVGGILSVDT